MSGGTADLVGMVQTVTGPMEADDLGVTLIHEHLLQDASGFYFTEHPDVPEVADGPVRLANRWWVANNPMSNRDNLVLDSVDVSVDELMLFRAVGGRSIVEMSSIGLRRPGHPVRLRQVAETASVNIVMGSGWYVALSHSADVGDLSEDEMVDILVGEVTEGMDGTGIKAGVLGELGVSEPFTDAERRVLRAAATAQRRTGVPIGVRPGMDDSILLDAVETLRDAGADMEHVIMGHQDISGYSIATRHEVAAAGCILAFDTFGYTLGSRPTTGWAYGLRCPTDTARLDDIESLLEAGFGKQIVLSQGICWKHALTTYGGHGYSHILRNIVPLMEARGYGQAVIDDLLVHNASRALSFGAPVAT